MLISPVFDYLHLPPEMRPDQKSPLSRIMKMGTLDFGANGRYTVVIHGAYNAMGVIDTKNNGVGILDDTKRQVLMSSYCGWVDEQSFIATEAEFTRLINMDWRQFQQLSNHQVGTHSRYII